MKVEVVVKGINDKLGYKFFGNLSYYLSARYYLADRKCEGCH